MRVLLSISASPTLNKPVDIRDVRRDLTTSLKQRYGVYVKVYVLNGDLVLDKLQVPAAQRNSGVGSKVMREISRYADKVKMDMTLVCSEKGKMGTTSVEDLLRFYARFGFRHDRRYSDKEYLIRRYQKSK